MLAGLFQGIESASIFNPPGSISGRIDFSVTPAGKLPGNKQCLKENYREISFLIHGCYCGNYDINIFRT